MPFDAGYSERRKVLFDANSTSSFTSAWHLVAEYAQLTMSYSSSVTGTANLIVHGSNDDGLRSSINSFSVLTTVTAAGLFTIDPGVRWLRAVRSSSSGSRAVVQLQMRS